MKIRGIGPERVKEALKNGEVTISVYGLGKLGLPLSLILADTGARVIGVDVNPGLIKRINEGISPIPFEPGVNELLQKALKEKRFRATTDGKKAAEESDVMVIVVPVLTDDIGRPDLTTIRSVASTISEGLSAGDVIITETTLPPGTTLSLGKYMEARCGLKLGKDFGVAHAPERTMSGRMIKDITLSYPKIVGASDRETLLAVKGIYEAINKRGVIEVSNPTVAEAVKIFEGVYRDVNIALANELALYSEIMGFDVIEAIRAANTQPYSHLHMPGAGVGGHCIPIYPYFIIENAKRKGLEMKLLSTAREVNDKMPFHVVYLTVKALNDRGKTVKGSTVLILGLTYRSGVKEYYKSPALKIIKELKDMGAKVYAYDPLTTKDEVVEMGAYPWENNGVDAVIVVNDDKIFRDMIYEGKVKVNDVIIDARRALDPRKIIDMGVKYWGVGYPQPGEECGFSRGA
ncbi:MAG: nucleotide sugar dehydrogenase [Thermoprotei archaeon]|nr:MAG: nucleotide sugar dehydrogenase [Thermoprotei archaeon]